MFKDLVMAVVLAGLMFALLTGCAQTPHISAKLGELEYYSSKNVSVEYTTSDGKTIKVKSDGAAVMEAQAALMAEQNKQMELFRAEIKSVLDVLLEKVK